MATTIITANNGDTGLEIRTAWNANDEALKVTADAAETKNITQDSRLDTLEAPLVSGKLAPQVTAPTHTEGQYWYDDIHKAVAVQTDVVGYPVHVGTDSVIRVINKTGILINAGQALRNGGIDATSNEIKAELAKADNLTTAFVIGFASNDIAPDAEGWAVEQGHVHDLNTFSLTVGGVLFLSDTVAGGVTHTPPDIASALGTVLIGSVDAGVYFTKIDNLITYPQATGYLRGQNTPTYNLTATPQDIVDYTLSQDVIMTVDPLLGTLTVPLNGTFYIIFTAVASFISSTSTRTVYFELYNETTSTLEGAYPRNIPRDATEEGISFTAPFTALAGHSYVMRVRSNVTMDIDFDNAAFMMTSTHLG